MPDFELVLPCYNESKSLAAIVERGAAAATRAGFTPETFQLVLVENGSKDDSAAVMATLAEGPQGRWFRTVQVTLNQGYGLGVWSGLSSTTAPFVGWSHADQQCDPNDAFRALATLKRSRAPKVLVKGVRSGRNWKDMAVTTVFESMARVLLGMRCDEINAQPKVFGRALLAEIAKPPNTFSFDLYVLYRAVKAGYAIETIEVLFPPRVHGLSNWASSFKSRRKTIAAMIEYMAQLALEEGRL